MVFLHLIYVPSSITLVLGYMFNKILVEGLLNTKIIHTIMSNHKFKGTCKLQNYHIILINHMLIKLSGVMLRKKLNSHYEVEEMQLQAKGELREHSLLPIIFYIMLLGGPSKGTKEVMWMLRRFLQTHNDDFVPRKCVLQRASELKIPFKEVFGQVSYLEGLE